MGKKEDITGAVGAVPPPDAPIENAAPLKPETIAHQQAMAAKNEQPRKPFKHQNKPLIQPVVQPAAPAPAAVVPDTQALIDDVFGAVDPSPKVVEAPSLRSGVNDFEPMRTKDIPANDAGLGEVEQMHDYEPTMMPLTPEDRQRMPAASDTDTPSKGLLPNLTPQLPPDKFEGINPGGFSDIGEAQYYPMDGSEALALAQTLGDTLFAEIPNDLRFSMALTYPRIRMTLQLIIEGHAEDNNAGFTIEKVAMPKEGKPGSTPVEVAERLADKVCFVVMVRRQEINADGSHDLPPDAIREELGLQRPRKQILEEGPMGQRFVDVAAPGMANVAAVTR